MKLVKASELADIPLAGCNEMIKDDNNGRVLRDHLLLRLRLFAGSQQADNLWSQIADELHGIAENAVVKPKEYLINELQYEIRLASKNTSEELESQIIAMWVMSHIVVKHTMDQALEFITVLKKNRERRTRSI